MLKAHTKILSISGSRYLLLPNLLVNDSAFPFDENDKLTICIDGDTLYITDENAV